MRLFELTLLMEEAGGLLEIVSLARGLLRYSGSGEQSRQAHVGNSDSLAK